jgi:carbamoylphosphate synthase large subunit
MTKNIECLIKACKKLAINFEIIDEESSSIRVDRLNRSYYFIQSSTPLNSSVDSKICKDKELSYILLKEDIRMPKSKGYIDPNLKKKFRGLVNIHKIEDIAKDIELNFLSTFSKVIIKPNSGKNGVNLAVCTNREEILKALQKIFNKKSKNYDYAVLAQEVIQIEDEFRVVILKGRVELVYEKTSHGKVRSIQIGKKNTASEIKDSNLLNKIQKFVSPILQKINIGFCGLDIAIDKNGNLNLIELNSQPSFDYFMKYNGEDRIVGLYEKVLKVLL